MLLGGGAALRAPAPRARRAAGRAACRPCRVVRVKAAGGEAGKREPWDVRRFAQTVLFFNPPPSVADVLLAPLRALGLASASATAAASAPFLRLDGTPAPPAAGRDVVLVAGATGGVGARCVRLLLSEGVRVRALVRDAAKARAALAAADAAHPGLLELALGDITQPATLAAQPLGAGLRGVICASAVTVAPKEGDTAARDKYKQGIKFYDPQIVGDTPEAVEYNGVRNLLAAVAPALLSSASSSPTAAAAAHQARPGAVTLFDAAAPDAGPAWGALDDVVMGGASASGISIVPTGGEGGGAAAVFAGRISTANSGGFASVRSRNFSPPANAAGAAGVELRLKGDGQRYKLFIRTEPGWDAMAYGVSFDTQPGAWQTVRLPLTDFRPIFRARTLPGAPPLDASRITSLQLMLSKFEYDGELNPAFAGDAVFSLPIERIATYTAADVAAAATSAPQGAPAPAWVHISSAGVTRPNRPGIDVAAEPPAVRMNDELGGLLTWKLAGEDAVRTSGVPYTVLRPCALTEEPRGAELAVDQGDVIKGKISRDDVAELAVAAALGRAGHGVLNATFEVKCTLAFSQPWTAEDAARAPPRRDWPALLGGLKPGVTGKTINGVYTGKQPEAAPQAAPTSR